MNILFLSDFHGAGTIPETIPDLVVCLGDIDPYEIRKIDAYYTCPKIGVLGNHDAPDYFIGTNVVNIHNRVFEIGGKTFAGFEGCPRYNRRKYLQYDDEVVEFYLQSIPQVDFFITHSNPSISNEFDEEDPHRGFGAFTKYLLEKKPRYMAHGHIHDAKTYTIGDTTIHSVYPYLYVTV